MIEELKNLAIENPGFTYMIARKTMPSLRDTTLKSFFGRMEDGLIKKHDKTHNIVTFFNNSEFIFRPLDDMEKMKSLEIAGFGIDEANEITLDMYNTVKSRVRQKVKGKEPTMYRTIIVLNPTEEDHWIPQLFLHTKPANHKMFTSTTFDNMQNLPDGYVEELKATYTEDMLQRMLYGLFGKVFKGSPVFPQFQRGNFVRGFEYDRSKPLIRGFDFGWNRPVCVWAHMHNTQIRVLAEMMGNGIYLKDFIKDEVLPYQINLFGEQILKPIDFCDPRGSDESDKGKSSVQVLNELGIYPAYRRTWIEEGLNIMKDLMDTKNADGDPNFLVHPRVKNIIDGLRGGYHRIQGEDKPFKDGFFDNVIDALRYLCLHSVQRARIGALNRDAQAAKSYVNPHTGRRFEI